MTKIHVYLQGKGGVGKSFSAVTHAQYKVHKKEIPLCFDTDPINATFHGYTSLNVKRVHIMDGNKIHERHFDQLIEQIAPAKEDVIIDNGAASFVPLTNYLINHNIPALLQEMGHELIVHTVITGGQAMTDTVNGFAQLSKQMPPETSFIVWLNPYWGAIEYEGKDFEEMKAYQENKERVLAIVRIPTLQAETFGHDLRDILQQRLTFNEALELPSLPIMTRQRLKIIRDQLFAQLDQAAIL